MFGSAAGLTLLIVYVVIHSVSDFLLTDYIPTEVSVPVSIILFYQYLARSGIFGGGDKTSGNIQ